MAFSEALKARIRQRAHLACCLCKSMGVEVHHIIPRDENGPDTEDNAAPLCPSCHEKYGANPQKRKFIREAHDFWYDECERRYALDPGRLTDIERVLKTIESHVQTATFPILPFALFYTLRHTTTPDAIEQPSRVLRATRASNQTFSNLWAQCVWAGLAVCTIQSR